MQRMMKLRQHQKESIEILHKSVKGIINLPTGTGKSLIQSRFIVESILQSNNAVKVYIIVSPRILLSNQLLSDVKRDLATNKIDTLSLSVHSGRIPLNQDFIIYRELKSTTSSIEIADEYQRAIHEKVPLIISSTYDSLERIRLSRIPIEVILCDEAHNLVTEEFEEYVRDIFGNKIFFFTATLKTTASDEGLGMNNIERFGEILYSKQPLEMIEAGEILRPRLHFATTSVPILNDDIISAQAVVECFNEHRTLLNIGAKMLITCKGSEHLNNIATHPEMIRLKRIRPNLTIFDISSEYKPRINGEEVNREIFLSRLQSLNDNDEAIILHIDILTEGIDVPGITGIMPLNNLTKAKFLQTLGRATRLYLGDRKRLYNNELKPNELDEFIKPYAYIIIPSYGMMGEDIRENTNNIIRELRSYNFNPSEDIIIKQTKGSLIPVSLQGLNELDTRINSIQQSVSEILHEIENEEEACKINNLVLNLTQLSGLYNLINS